MKRTAIVQPSGSSHRSLIFKATKHWTGLLAILLSVMVLWVPGALKGGMHVIDLEGTPGPIVAGDLNGDRHIDFVVGDQEREVVVVLLGEWSEDNSQRPTDLHIL